MRKFFLIMLVLFMHIAARGQDTYSYRYWFDDDSGHIVEGTSPASEWHLDVPVEDLDYNMHVLHVQVGSQTNGWSVPISKYFLKVPYTKATDLSEMKCCYIIDNQSTVSQMGLVTDNIYHLDIDVSTLSDGLHRVIYWLEGNDGMMTRTNTAFFTKIPLGGNGIIRYEYWLNDNYNDRHLQDIDPRQEKVDLISLLPVETMPIRSSCFEFRIKDNQPLIYAKNDFHIRFKEATGRFTDLSKQFVDEKVSENVIPTGELQETQTFERVEENGIRWYTVPLEEGDSVAFKSSQACTMQLFSPSGEEVYSASGAASVNYDGCHAWEKGTYYLAVHDVMGSQSSVTLEYEHIDKYAVLSYTPNAIGNAKDSEFILHLYGNGFEKLEGASLVFGDQVLREDSMFLISNTRVDILFSINQDEVPKGRYDLNLYYVDENLTISEAILFEEPNYADVKISIIDRSNMAKPFPISVIVENEGNMSYSFIPLNVAWDNPLAVENVAFNNFYASMAAKNDSAGYSFATLTENLLGKGVDGAVMFFYIPRLGSHEKMNLQFDFTAPAHTRFNLYAWTGKPLEVDSTWWESKEAKMRRVTHSNTSNRGQNVVNFGDALNGATGATGDGLGRTGSQVLSNAGSAISLGGSNANTDFKIGATIGSGINAMGRSIGDAWINANGVDEETANTIAGAYDQLYPEVMTPGSIIGGDVGEWVNNLMGLQNNCAQNPMPDPGNPHSVHIVVPGDPNDIVGYTSESGSLYLRKDVNSVSYTIEFENDPKIADAAAHTIIVCDTLDADYFDLASFEFTNISIGEVTTFIDAKSQYPITVDLRPVIDVIAQVSLDYNNKNGIAKWTIESLDPMSMEQTTDAMQGVLPVNIDGKGLGELTFDIKLKEGLNNGQTLSNRAGIVFDQENTIMTPTWTNVIDAIAPNSHVVNVTQLNNSTAAVHMEATDELSGVWRYDVYVQYGEDASWWKAASGLPADSVAEVRMYTGMNQGFCVVATDSAGNVEVKEIVREFTLDVPEVAGDANGDGVVNLSDAAATVKHYVGQTPDNFNASAADVDGNGIVNLSDARKTVSIYVGKEAQSPQEENTDNETEN